MQATKPQVVVPGDNENRIMARSGDCLGMSPDYSVWRFGFTPVSDACEAYGVYMPDHFLWVLTIRSTGEVIETWRGIAVNLPSNFRDVIDWVPTGVYR